MGERSLAEFVSAVRDSSHLRVEQDFGGGFVRLQVSEAERRQAAQDIKCSEDIVLELLRNSRDAHARSIFIASCKEGTNRLFTVLDDGDGIPAPMHDLVFEPRVTSKLDTSHKDAWGMHGRGMALYSISENATSARVVSSSPELGCSISVVSDVGRLAEKADQSSFPTFTIIDGVVRVRGPRNIVRTVCEFAIEERAQCSVYIGSPVEIACSMYETGKNTLAPIERVFCEDAEALPVTKRLATAGDPKTFADIAESVGLDISERSARRILDGEVIAAAPILERVEIASGDAGSSRKAKKVRAQLSNAIRLDRASVEEFKASAKRDFAGIAESHYLEPDVDVAARVVSGRLVVSIPLVPKE